MWSAGTLAGSESSEEEGPADIGATTGSLRSWGRFSQPRGDTSSGSHSSPPNTQSGSHSSPPNTQSGSYRGDVHSGSMQSRSFHTGSSRSSSMNRLNSRDSDRVRDQLCRLYSHWRILAWLKTFTRQSSSSTASECLKSFIFFVSPNMKPCCSRSLTWPSDWIPFSNCWLQQDLLMEVRLVTSLTVVALWKSQPANFTLT